MRWGEAADVADEIRDKLLQNYSSTSWILEFNLLGHTDPSKYLRITYSSLQMKIMMISLHFTRVGTAWSSRHVSCIEMVWFVIHLEMDFLLVLPTLVAQRLCGSWIFDRLVNWIRERHELNYFAPDDKTGGPMFRLIPFGDTHIPQHPIGVSSRHLGQSTSTDIAIAKLHCDKLPLTGEH